MSREIYNSVLRKLAVEVPLFAETILENALTKIGTTPDEATPFQLKTAIEKYVEPALKEKLHVCKGIHELGMGTVVLDKDGKVKTASPSAKKLIPDINTRKFLLGKDLTSDTLKVKGNSINILRIPDGTIAMGSGDSLCIISDVTLDKELDKEMAEKYQELLQANQKQRVSDEALKESEERFRKAASVASDLIYEWDIKKGTIDWYGDVDKVLGYKKDTFPRTLKAWLGSIHKDDLKQLEGSADLHMTSTKPIYEEYRIKTKRGKYRYWVDKGVPVVGDDGKPEKWIGVCTDITAEKEARISIEKSEQHLKSVLNSIRTGIMIIDAETHKILDINNCAEEMIGVSKKNIVGKVCNRFVCPAMKGRCPVTDLGKTVDCSEKVLVRKDGKQIPILKSVVPVKRDGRNILIESFIDVSESKKAQEMLARSEVNYKTIFNTVSDAIFIHDIKTGKILDVNQTMLDMYDYTKEEVLKLNIGAISENKPPHTQKEAIRKVMAAARGHPQKFEWHCKKRSGELFWAEVQLKKVIISGKPSILAVVTDIQDQKDAEKEIQESEERLRDLFDNVEDLIQSVDAQGKIVYVNSYWKTVLGYSDKDISGMRFIDILRKDVVPHCMDIFNRICAGELVHNVETVFIAKDGREVMVSGNINAHFKDGQLVNTRAIFRDVTQEKKSEEELLKRNEELERFNKLAVGRELKMIELKKRINELEAQIGSKEV